MHTHLQLSARLFYKKKNFFPCHNYLAIRVYYAKYFLYFKSDITFNVQSVDQFTLTSFDAVLADWGLGFCS